MDVALGTSLHTSLGQIQSVSLPSQSLSTSFRQKLEPHHGKPGHKGQAFVVSEGKRQSRDHLDNISIEELAEGEIENASEADILRPDIYEDADSVEANEVEDQGYESEDDTRHHGGIIEGLRTLRCCSDEDEVATSTGREKRKKRRSIGIFKRSYSQSIGGDTDDEPPHAHGLEHSARRLRRRVRGPDDDSTPEGTPSTEVECEELEDVVPRARARNESEMEDYSTESMSMDTTEDAMDID